MNQAINLIDEMKQKVSGAGLGFNGMMTMELFFELLEQLKKQISSLPSETQWIDVNSLKNQIEQSIDKNEEGYEIK